MIEYVYVIGESQDSPCKIGASVNPAARKVELQIGNPRELYILGTIGYEFAFDVEREFHAQFVKFNVRGEWYNMNPWRAIEYLSLLVQKDQTQRLRQDGDRKTNIERSREELRLLVIQQISNVISPSVYISNRDIANDLNIPEWFVSKVRNERPGVPFWDESRFEVLTGVEMEG